MSLNFTPIDHISRPVWETRNCGGIYYNYVCKGESQTYFTYLIKQRNRQTRLFLSHIGKSQKRTQSVAHVTPIDDEEVTPLNSTAVEMLSLLYWTWSSRGQLSWACTWSEFIIRAGKNADSWKNVCSHNCIISPSCVSYDCHNSRLDQRGKLAPRWITTLSHSNWLIRAVRDCCSS